MKKALQLSLKGFLFGSINLVGRDEGAVIRLTGIYTQDVLFKAAAILPIYSLRVLVDLSVVLESEK